MSGKTLYDVLGVNQDATAEQIRAAYLLRSKVLHPDRLDQARQPTEWKLANEMVKELSHAYSVLRNSLDRSDYDRSLSGQTTRQSSQTHQSAPRSKARPANPSPPRPTVKLGKLKSGKTYFELLPRSIQERLKKRISGANDQQVSVKISGVGGNYFVAAVFCGWYWLLFASAGDIRWTSAGFWFFLGITGLVAFLQGLNADWILNWHFSPLRYRLLVTPFYFIKTRWNEVWFWPLPDKMTFYLSGDYAEGHSIELIPQVGGNLDTKHMSAKDW